MLITSRSKFKQVLEEESLACFKLPGTKIKSFKKLLPVDSTLLNTATPPSILQRLKPARNSKQLTNSKGVEKQFDIVKISGHSEYFKEVNRRF